jgi:hypothetical protein
MKQAIMTRQQARSERRPTKEGAPRVRRKVGGKRRSIRVATLEPTKEWPFRQVK